MIGRPARSRLRVAVTLAAVLLAGAALSPSAPPAGAAAPGFHVRGTQILDSNGKPFVIRGVNHLNASNPGQTAQAMADIHTAGANTVRLTVVGHDSADGTTLKASPQDIAAMIAGCKKLSLVCIFTDQETSGYGDSGSATAISLADAVTYWKTVESAFVGQEAYAIIDIGNMPFGNTTPQAWPAAAAAAIKAMRANGFRNLLTIGAPNFGEDSGGVMRANAPKVFAADPMKNTAFSILMYANYYNLATVKSYVDSFQIRNLPLIISEFSWAYLPWGVWNASNGGADGPDEASIMAYAQKKGIGWAAYAWSASSSEKAYDDMTVHFNAAATTPWYDTVVNGPNGLKQTSKPASVYR